MITSFNICLNLNTSICIKELYLSILIDKNFHTGSFIFLSKSFFSDDVDDIMVNGKLLHEEAIDLINSNLKLRFDPKYVFK